MDQNNLLFLKSQIKAFHPNWSEAQVEMEAIRIINSPDEEDTEDCLYCGS
jgi:hypothetical protein